jgi:hypothetical protein
MMTTICAAEKVRRHAARRVRLEVGVQEEEDSATANPGLDAEPPAVDERACDAARRRRAQAPGMAAHA